MLLSNPVPLSQLQARRNARLVSRQARLAALGSTLAVQRKWDLSRRIVERFLRSGGTPAISCGGGKDSTLTVIVTHSVDPSVPVVTADPPNPLPDRERHVRMLSAVSGSEWHRVGYPWDVDAVLAGDIPYPEFLKLRVLRSWHEKRGIDSVILGVRKSESRDRHQRLDGHGPIWTYGNLRYCAPIAHWTADEVVGFQLWANKLPVNPCYFKLAGAHDLEHLRDGTWYPREYTDAGWHGPWLLRHYPEVYDDYTLARAIQLKTSAER